jgi:uncharacterized protein (DUF1800 family)
VGWEAWLDGQLDPASLDDSATDALLDGYDLLDLTYPDLFSHVVAGREALLVAHISHSALIRMVHSTRQLQEVMVDFWRNHFNVSVVNAPQTVPYEIDHARRVTRLDPFGRFADLLVADAQSPAMLVYLDQGISSSTGPDGVNLNFSRETLELHTLGIVDGVQPFTEADVVGLANVLAGFSVDAPAGEYTYEPSMHAPIAVSMLDGAWTTPGRIGAEAEQDGLDVLTFLARRPETARHLAWKLARRFVADDPPDALVDELAQVYLDHDTEIAPVLRALLTSDALFEAGPKYRRGLEAVVASLRATDAAIAPDPQGPAVSSLHTVEGALAGMGQELYRHPSPDGYPDAGSEWLSSDSTLQRWGWNGRLARGAVDGIEVDIADLLALPVPDRAGPLVDRVVERLLGPGPPLPDPGFVDVPSTHAFFRDVAWMASAAISTGYEDRTYRPDAAVTRQAMSAFLHRAAGAPTFDPPTSPTFIDVGTTHPFFVEVEWMAANAISTGYADHTYRPGAPVTRQAMSAFLHRALGSATFAPPEVPTFTDVRPGQPFYADIEWMAASSITTGYLDGTFRGSQPVSRQAMSAYLYRAAGSPGPSPLPLEDRRALVSVLGGEWTPVTDALLGADLADLVGLTLSTPTFQHR